MSDGEPDGDDAGDFDPLLLAMVLAAEHAHDGGDPDAAHKIAALAGGDEDDDQADTDVYDPANYVGGDDE